MEGKKNTKYDLEERTLRFSEATVTLCKVTAKNTVTVPIISQFIRAATSIGANYVEANNASSKKDFRNKIFICKKESQETKYWLRVLVKAVPEKAEALKKLWQECHELNLIFQKITKTLRE